MAGDPSSSAGCESDAWPPLPNRSSDALAERPTEPHRSRTADDSLFARCVLFASLPADLLRLLESRMERVAFAAGETILRQGEPGRHLLVVGDGTVEISTRDEQGGRHFIASSGPGDVLGEMSLLTREPCAADAVAATPVTALRLPAARFHKLARERPALSVALTHLIAGRLGQAGRDVLAGKTLEGYRIGHRLGRGGMAVVYEAHEAASGRRVALKMMSHRLVYDHAALAQFQREADLIASLAHDNIVRTYGRFAAFRTFFIVMQFCDGQSLGEIIPSHGKVPEPRTLAILGQLVRGLRAAHAAGVIHRDVKPSNVLVSRNGSVQLTDFGLARPALDDDSLLRNLVVGTPQYMAPEQLLGQDLDERADYFGLGCVAYEMLCGRPLLPDGNVAAVLRRHQAWTPPDLDRACPGLSAPTRRLLETCLAKDPESRRPDLDWLSSCAGPAPALLS